MSTEARAALLERAVTTAATSDSGALAEIFTDDVRFVSPIVEVTSVEALKAELDDRDDAFSDVKLTVTALDVVGDRGYAEWTASATHAAPVVIDDLVVEPTGSSMTLSGITVAEFQDDRIASMRQYWNEADLLEGLGLIPSE